MKITVSHDFDGGVVHILIEAPPGTPPERAADAAWAAVDDALTALQKTSAAAGGS